MGLFTTALFVTHVAIQVPGGRASDRFGPARAGAVALACIVVGDLVALTTASAAVAIVARAITGIGTGLTFLAGSALVRESGGSPFAQGLFGGIGLGSAGLALTVVPQLEGPLDWRAPYWSSLAIAVVAAALVATELTERRGRVAGAALPARSPAASPLLRDGRLYRLAGLYGASYGLSVVVGNWVIELLERHTTLSSGLAAAIGGLTLLLNVVARPFGGWVLRAHPERARAVVAGSLGVGALGTVALVAAGPAWLAVVGSALVGFAAGVPFSAVFTGAAATRPDSPAAAVGFVNSLANAAILAGTPLVGLTFAMSGEGRLGFVVIAALWAAALLALPGRRSLGAAIA